LEQIEKWAIVRTSTRNGSRKTVETIAGTYDDAIASAKEWAAGDGRTRQGILYVVEPVEVGK